MRMLALRFPLMNRRLDPEDDETEAEDQGAAAPYAVDADADEAAFWRQRWHAAQLFLRSLFDLEFRQLLTPRMLPTLYLLGIVASAYAVLGYVIEGFSHSIASGFVRLLLVGPVAFVVLVTLTRVALEFCIAIFRIAVHVNELAGHAEDIAEGIPRISFWKPRKKR